MDQCPDIQTRHLRVRDLRPVHGHPCCAETDTSQRATLETDSFPHGRVMAEIECRPGPSSMCTSWRRVMERLASDNPPDHAMNHAGAYSRAHYCPSTHQKGQHMRQEDAIRDLKSSSSGSWDCDAVMARPCWSIEDDILESFGIVQGVSSPHKDSVEPLSGQDPSSGYVETLSPSSILGLPDPTASTTPIWDANPALNNWWPEVDSIRETKPPLYEVMDQSTVLSPEMWPTDASWFEEPVSSSHLDSGQAFVVHSEPLAEQLEKDFQDNSNPADSVASTVLREANSSLNLTWRYVKGGSRSFWPPENASSRTGDRSTDSVPSHQSSCHPGSWQKPSDNSFQSTFSGRVTPITSGGFPSGQQLLPHTELTSPRGTTAERPIESERNHPKRILPWPREEEAGGQRLRGLPGQTLGESSIHPRNNCTGKAQRQDSKDEFLVHSKRAGMSYKQIKEIGQFSEAESTLRGRFRTLTKHKEHRVRKPEWYDADVSTSKVFSEIFVT